MKIVIERIIDHSHSHFTFYDYARNSDWPLLFLDQVEGECIEYNLDPNMGYSKFDDIVADYILYHPFAQPDFKIFFALLKLYEFNAL